MRPPRAAVLAALWCVAAVAAEPALPNADAAKHLGARSCADHACHGASAASPFAVVQQNEYSVWSSEDRHSRAFRALASPLASSMARKLGLKRPGREPLCLDCHTDNVPANRRGAQYSVADGVACEACHGGAQRWLGDHSLGQRSHAQNVAAGMFPTDEPLERARLCFRCHLGTPERPMTHQLMAAGHPRLAIELDTFTHAQPAHFVADADYATRKPHAAPVRTWALGQAQAAAAWIAIARAAGANAGMFPEISLFECAACHRSLGTGVPGGGQPPLDLSRWQMLAIVAERVAPAQARDLNRRIQVLAHAPTTQVLAEQLAPAQEIAARVVEACDARELTVDDARAWLDRLLRGARAGEFRQHAAAEQVTYSAATLVAAVKGENAGKAVDDAVAALYDEADRAGRFDASLWQAAANRLSTALGGPGD